MNKYTVESLKQKGYIGVQHNTMTDHKMLNANYVLDKIAWTANNKPQRLCFINNDVSGKVVVRIKNEQWTPYTTLDCYAERDMTKEELVSADKRLAKLGMMVNRIAE